ncbi:hypothetical protein PAT01_31260 [Pseudoalteromonas atlantica]|uniref:Uncharacterized protein n=1 Tax=Pseudoalteromonas atlantica TaxID=288 RepID=A0ABQ0UH93_PSEAF|nr:MULTISPECIES: hypothetical protein [unclassified Pseudoalteromonas]TMO06487.1 hypothetical protein CWB60_09840 [Pseudoalteromonas sp. S327]TMO19810.1 hypothetical protein CWB59_03695 [Pseudoalteromonas sp. S326]GEK77822.1 hypothetical protein PAT01_31260 [Pseudoalteromonas atlantica]
MEVNASSISIKKWGGISIALLLSFEFLVFPWLDWLDSSKNELKSLEKIVVKQESLLASDKQVQNNSESIAANLSDFSQLPTLDKNQDPALLWLQVIDAAVERYELSINNKAPFREVKINDAYSVYAGRLNVSGSYNEVLNLLYELENVKKGNRVRQVSFSRTKATPDKVTANIEFVRVFKRS